MKKSSIFVLMTIAFIVIARVTPHITNFSPMICVALVAGSVASRRMAMAIVAVGMLCSDLILAQVMHYPVAGLWSLFTYSGLFAVIFLGAGFKELHQEFAVGAMAVLGADLGFWAWTNFGSWLTDYPHTASGLAACFTAGLPFLQHSALSALVWFSVYVVARRSWQLVHESGQAQQSCDTSSVFDKWFLR